MQLRELMKQKYATVIDTVEHSQRDVLDKNLPMCTYGYYDLHGMYGDTQAQWLQYLIKDKIFNLWVKYSTKIKDLDSVVHTHKLYTTYKAAKQAEELYQYTFSFTDKKTRNCAIESTRKALNTLNAKTGKYEQHVFNEITGIGGNGYLFYSFSSDVLLDEYFRQEMKMYYNGI